GRSVGGRGAESSGGSDAESSRESAAAEERESRPRPDRKPAAGPGGLPRRVRQANLAPQLKAEPTAEAERKAAEPEPERDAEEVRARMASVQRGWQRGRQQEAADPEDTGRTAPGTTSEGDGR
ncbi:histidine kinase, partial [Streptomyces sp. H27-D2]|nr:histidine kinase [Streptomyces sp. H27-D2]